MAKEKQLEVLRAYAAACGDSPRAVANPEVASIIGLKADTVSMVNGFFASLELLTKTDSGYVPSEEVFNYAKAYQWNQETAFWRTSPKFAKSWFAEAILPKLRFKSLTVDEAIGMIGQVAGVGPDVKRELELALWFLEQSGVVERENGTVKIGKTQSPDEEKKDEEKPDANGAAVQKEKPRVASSNKTNKVGAIRLNVEINVEMEEIAKWTPERITSFMSGLAQVLAAKGQPENVGV